MFSEFDWWPWDEPKWFTDPVLCDPKLKWRLMFAICALASSSFDYHTITLPGRFLGGTIIHISFELLLRYHCVKQYRRYRHYKLDNQLAKPT